MPGPLSVTEISTTSPAVGEFWRSGDDFHVSFRRTADGVFDECVENLLELRGVGLDHVRSRFDLQRNLAPFDPSASVPAIDHALQ